jgi:hypothetical protein
VDLRIFLNYRREDTSGHAGRLYDALAGRFGPDNVFMDVDTIGLGSDFAAVIEGAVKQCDVLIALIGSRWLNAAGEDGRRRLDDPDDFVRLELESALASDLSVIPVTVQDAVFPDPNDLPTSLAPLARRQGIELRDTAWHDDTNRLIRRLERIVEEQGAEVTPPRPVRRSRRLLWVALALVALAIVGVSVAMLVRGGGGDSSGDSSVDPTLLNAIPAAVRPSCHAVSYGEQPAEANADCAASHVSAIYYLFPSAAVLDGWYAQQREGVGIAPGSGACKPTSFRGEGSYAGGRYFCFVDSSGEATIGWTQTGTRVGAIANVYEGKGPSAAASLLRQWSCCLRG